jgi:hypothetical protein
MQYEGWYRYELISVGHSGGKPAKQREVTRKKARMARGTPRVQQGAKRPLHVIIPKRVAGD